jgi:predicted dienelactone hydrolase
MPSNTYQAGFKSFNLITRVPGKALRCAIWYPSLSKESDVFEGPWRFSVAFGSEVAPGRYPMVVLSHGTGSSWREHHDTAELMARRGFVAVALSHLGDSYDYGDQDLGGLLSAVSRPGQVSQVIDEVLRLPPFESIIDAQRIGVIGFSIGAYTAFVLAGARPDFDRIRTHPADDPPSVYFGGSEGDRSALARKFLSAGRPGNDPRVRSILVMAPALGFLFDEASLADVRVPVRLYRAEHDQVLYYPYDGETYRRSLPMEPETIVVRGAGHYVFLAPPPVALVRAHPDVFQDTPAFDREAFHHRLNAEVVDFFCRTLR